jgi:hypothetical protein
MVCDRAVLLPAVATLTSGIDPVRRHQLWDTVCTQTEILRDLDNNYLHAVRTYLGIAAGEPIDADELRDQAIEDQADALDQLLNRAPHLAAA